MHDLQVAERPATKAQADEMVRGVDKVDKYGWEVQDRPGDLEMIHKKQLIINDDYQRAASPTKILELARNWSWVACGAIIVARREGSYWVVDGQHRVLAARKRSDIANLPCIVFAVSEVAEEARGFLNANANRKAVSAVAKHRAAVVAGDANAVALQGILDEFGIAPSKTNDGNPNHISCVASAAKKASESAPEFKAVFAVAVELARAADQQVHATLLDGLWYLNRNIDGGIADPRLRKRLFETGANRLVESANRAAAFFAKGGSRVWATGMLEAVNKGLHRRFSLKGDAL